MPSEAELLRYLEANPRIADHFKLKWPVNPYTGEFYIPHKPTPKQRAYLCLYHEEALFGGAAGGGKTDALLMGALQNVDVPGYSAIIFRRTLTDHRLPDSSLSRMMNWLQPHLQNRSVKFNGQENTFHFPTFNADGTPGFPSLINFGYIGEEAAEYRYQSSAYQYIGWDEVSQHLEANYTYLFSRLRRIRCPIHGDKPIDVCANCKQLSQVPLKVRGATNPGGFGHRWIKDRFRITGEPDPDNPGKLRYVGKDPNRPFIPALARDNPYLDYESYEKTLQNLPKVVREQLLAGDWSISHDSRYKAHWFRRWSRYGNSYVLGEDGHGPTFRLSEFIRIIFCVDPASTAKESPGDTQIVKGAPVSGLSFTVIGVFGVTKDYNLVWLDNLRVRAEVPDILNHVRTYYNRWHPSYITVEAIGGGKAVYQLLAAMGLPVKAVYPHTDKLTRAASAMLLAEKGRIWLPQRTLNMPWLKDLEDEVFTWIGHPQEIDDQIDVLSMAGMDIASEAISGGFVEQPLAPNEEETILSESPFIISANSSHSPADRNFYG